MKLSTAMEIVESAIINNQKLTGRTSQYITPMLWGVAGVGKTSSVEALVARMGLEFRDFRANQYDAGELGGLPWAEDGRMIRLRPNFLPTEGSGVLMVDELPQAPVANQNIIGQLVNERRIGEHVLPDGWTIVCAGNQLHHRAGTNAMPSHLKDRLLHLVIEPDLNDALDYMTANGIRREVVSFLKFAPDHLSKFDKDVNACPSPRSWEKVSQILDWNLSPLAERMAIIGQVGEGSAAFFETHLQVCRDLPDPEAPLKDPDNAEISSDPSIRYAICANIAYTVKQDTVVNFFKYLKRLPEQEYTAFAVKSALNRVGKDEFRDWARKHTEVREWLTGDAKYLILEEAA